MSNKEHAQLKDNIIRVLEKFNSDVDIGVYGEPDIARTHMLQFLAEVYSYRVRCSNLSTKDSFGSGLIGVLNGIYASDHDVMLGDISSYEESLIENEEKMLEHLAETFAEIIADRIEKEYFGENPDHLKKIALEAIAKKLS